MAAALSQNLSDALKSIRTRPLFVLRLQVPPYYEVGATNALKPRAVLQRLSGDPDDCWIFTRDRVWIERRDGEIVEERSQPRAAFAGHDRNTPWDELHLTNFLGYRLPKEQSRTGAANGQRGTRY
jgi:hypothetical protein